jgi:hypothetical protein
MPPDLARHLRAPTPTTTAADAVSTTYRQIQNQNLQFNFTTSNDYILQGGNYGSPSKGLASLSRTMWRSRRLHHLLGQHKCSPQWLFPTIQPVTAP